MNFYSFAFIFQYATPLISPCDWNRLNSNSSQQEQEVSQSGGSSQDQLVVFDPELFKNAVVQQQARLEDVDSTNGYSGYDSSNSERKRNFIAITMDEMMDEESQHLKRSFNER